MINRESVQFLGGFLNALSSVDGDIGDYTMTAIIIENTDKDLVSSVINFYELPYDNNSVKSKIVEFYSMEKIIDSKILQKPFNNSINYDKNRNHLLSYKIMDYIQYCFDDFLSLDFDNISVFDIKLNFENYKTEFLAISVDNDENIFIISFWEKLK